MTPKKRDPEAAALARIYALILSWPVSQEAEPSEQEVIEQVDASQPEQED